MDLDSLIANWLATQQKEVNRKEIEAVLDWSSKPHNALLTLDDPAYPDLLRQINHPPPLLFVKGNVAILREPQIAVVGCRQMSAYGAENAFQFSKALASLGLTVTSGLALGIDTLAHQGALAAKGHTIAVLGTGIEAIYPAQNKKLAHEIAANGAIISQFPLDTPPLRYNFPKRNRIISALSLGVLVVEAAHQSGSLITARYALEQNREVFAIPGSIHNAASRGCHYLIKEGAVLVESLADLLIHLKEKLLPMTKENLALQLPPLQLQTQKKHVTPIKKTTHPLLKFFSIETVSLDTLLIKTQQSIESLNKELILLELAGSIERTAGGYKLK